MVVISDVTRQLVDADFYMHSLGERQLKGISRPVEVFAVERPRYAAARFEAERYRKAGLVGRDEPRDRCWRRGQAIRRARRRAGGAAFLVVGEAGIGKSRLVAEVLDRVEASGGRVLGAACLPYYANVSLWPIARLLERVLGGRGAGRRTELAALVAHLASWAWTPCGRSRSSARSSASPRPPEYPAPELDPSAFLDETLDRLVEWLSALARRTPHLLVVEDLHWADPSTLALLGRLVDRRPGGMLTVATTRDIPAVPWRDAVRVLELGRLDAGGRHGWSTTSRPGRELDDDQRASIIEQAEGIPLFIEELTRSCLDEDRTETDAAAAAGAVHRGGSRRPASTCASCRSPRPWGRRSTPATVSAVIGDAAVVAEQLGVLADEGIIEPVGPGRSAPTASGTR